MSINNVVIVGRLTKEVDLRFTPSGVAVANGTIAINRPFKNAQGENEADFINVVVWRSAAENTANFTKKGDRVGVIGRLQSRSYDDKDGKKVFVTEVVADSVQFLETKGSKKNDSNPKSNAPFNAPGNAPTDGEPIDISDDDLPF